jgi:hypothetical protein
MFLPTPIQNDAFNYYKVPTIDLWQNLFDKEDCTGPPRIMYNLQITNGFTMKAHKPFTDFNRKLRISQCNNHIYPAVANEQCCVTSLDVDDEYVSSSYYFIKSSQNITKVPKSAYGYNYCQVSNDELKFVNSLKVYEFGHGLHGYRLIYILLDSCFAGIKCYDDKLYISKTANCNSTQMSDYIDLDSIYKQSKNDTLKQFNESEAALTYKWLAYVPLSKIGTTFNDKWGLFALSVLTCVLTINIIVIFILAFKYKRTKNNLYATYISGQLLWMIAEITNVYKGNLNVNI